MKRKLVVADSFIAPAANIITPVAVFFHAALPFTDRRVQLALELHSFVGRVLVKAEWKRQIRVS